MKILIVCLLLAVYCFGSVGYVWADDTQRRGIWVPLPSHVSYKDETIFLSLKYVDYADLYEVFNNFSVLSYKKIIIDLFSFGGSVFDALAIVALFEDQQRAGKIVEIHAKGIVASAGLVIMMCGTPEHRFIDRNAFIMFHEMKSFKWMAMESVSDEEEQAKINRKIQDSINKYISSHTKITPAMLSEKIQKKEMWCDAKEAVELGFADKIIGE